VAGRFRLVALKMTLSAGQAAGSRPLGLAIRHGIAVPLLHGDYSIPGGFVLRGRGVWVGHGVARSPHTVVLGLWL